MERMSCAMNPEAIIRYCYNYNIFIYAMVFFCITGVVIACCLLTSYRRMQRSLLLSKEKKDKFLMEISIAINQIVQDPKKSLNVNTFVDKFVDEQKKCGLLISTWESICGQMTSLCLLIASCTAILGIFYECEQSKILFTFLTGAWTAIFVNIVNNIINISRRRKKLILNLTEYINNALTGSSVLPELEYPRPTDLWKADLPKSKKISRQQERLRQLKEEVVSQNKRLAREIEIAHAKEVKRQQKREQKEKDREEKRKQKETLKQEALNKKQIETSIEKESVHISLKERRKAKAVIKAQLNLERSEAKRQKEEQRINARLKAEQEKEKQRILRQELKDKDKDAKKSRAYEEKMRLKREKERIEAIRQQESTKSRYDENEHQEEVLVAKIPQELLSSEDKEDALVETFDDSLYDADVQDSTKEAKEQAASSQEDEVLLEEVLKDFFR